MCFVNGVLGKFMQVINTNHYHMKKIYVGRNYKRLKSILEKHAKNTDTLIPNRSTCTNESFNLVFTLKAP